MKKLLVILLLLVSGNVMAEHHRQHALSHLEVATSRTAAVSNFVNTFAANYECPTETVTPNPGQLVLTPEERCALGLSALGIVQRRLGLLEAGLVNLEVSLLNPSISSLDESRRLVNQPNSGDQPESLLRQILFIEYFAGQVIRRGLTHETTMASVVVYSGLAWEALDRVAWHINDAIREELYQDPAFAE